MSSTFLEAVDGRGVATLTLDRPDRHNAFDDALIAELTAALRRLGGDPGVRAVVLASSGRSFSAGADLEWMRRMARHSFEANLADAAALAGLLHTLDRLPKPTLALVQGAAYGGGVGLVACCDVAVASERAGFCLSEVKLGLTPATISPYVVNASRRALGAAPLPDRRGLHRRPRPGDRAGARGGPEDGLAAAARRCCGRSSRARPARRRTPRTWSSFARGGRWTPPSGRRRGGASPCAAPRPRDRRGSRPSSTSARPPGGPGLRRPPCSARSSSPTAARSPAA
jgi:hypothetical protein